MSIRQLGRLEYLSEVRRLTAESLCGSRTKATRCLVHRRVEDLMPFPRASETALCGNPWLTLLPSPLNSHRGRFFGLAQPLPIRHRYRRPTAAAPPPAVRPESLVPPPLQRLPPSRRSTHFGLLLTLVVCCHFPRGKQLSDPGTRTVEPTEFYACREPQLQWTDRAAIRNFG